jgi:hypothetical protein
MPKDKNKTLWLDWSNKEDDLWVHYPRSCDGAFLLYVLTALKIDKNKDSLNIIQELDRRGYDIKTLKISIDRKSPEHISTRGEEKTLRKSNGQYN